MKPFTVYGWRLSYFTAKINCYFQYKKIPTVFKPMNAYDLFRIAPKYTGASVMPIVKTPDGKWLQDTRDMIEQFEKSYPSPSIFPQSPELLFVSNLFEAWGDEFWIPIAMHYRWRYPENVVFFRKEANEQLLPKFIPSFIKNQLTDRTVKVLTSFLPIVGDRPEQFQMIELWTEDVLSKLDKHFASSNYLLGDAATIGDFGLAGPLVAHLCRDPYSKEKLMAPYPNVLAWAERIHSTANSGKSLTETISIAPTLKPILKIILAEFVPMIKASIPLVTEFQKIPAFGKEGKPLPRALGEIEFPFLNNQSTYKRKAIPFNLWKFQKVLDGYKKDKVAISKFLSDNSFDSKIFEELEFPKLQRKALKVKFAKE